MPMPPEEIIERVQGCIKGKEALDWETAFLNNLYFPYNPGISGLRPKCETPGLKHTRLQLLSAQIYPDPNSVPNSGRPR